MAALDPWYWSHCNDLTPYMLQCQISESGTAFRATVKVSRIAQGVESSFLDD